MIKEYGDVLPFQAKRVFNTLAKRMLVLIEDLQNDHKIQFDVLRENLPQFQEVIDQADYFSDPKFQYIRKKILDISGDAFRELYDELVKYDYRLKGKNEYENAK